MYFTVNAKIYQGWIVGSGILPLLREDAIAQKGIDLGDKLVVRKLRLQAGNGADPGANLFIFAVIDVTTCLNAYYQPLNPIQNLFEPGPARRTGGICCCRKCRAFVKSA